jgi:hypothetical protein
MMEKRWHRQRMCVVCDNKNEAELKEGKSICRFMWGRDDSDL